MLNQFMRAEEVARELEVSKSYAYKLIQQLNAELREKGCWCISFGAESKWEDKEAWNSGILSYSPAFGMDDVKRKFDSNDGILINSTFP